MWLYVESDDIALWDHEAEQVAEGIPGNFFEDKSSGCNAEHSLDLVLILHQLALVLGNHVVLDGLGDDSTASFLGLDHVLEPRLLHLQQVLGLVVGALLGKRLEVAVEVGLRTVVHQGVVAAVLLQN